ncbi:MAG: ATP synthase subunit I [Ilumatobacter coccineus]|uniref:ATP synthase subunit I n=1 Tax=Ilumatobacter coccineus TaxID=467094 RepID=A0A2G6K7G7_9ACTN|nr:MAG: ATP synthase subunit I [Ilumatobacter coccineus]
MKGDNPEVAVTRDMVRRGLLVAPVLILICGLIWKMPGVWGSAYGIALILINFGLSAGIIAFTSRISGPVLMGGVLFGYLFRLAALFGAVFAIKDAGWASLPAVGTSILVAHLGLLVWELKYVALSLAYPGLKPQPPAPE